MTDTDSTSSAASPDVVDLPPDSPPPAKPRRSGGVALALGGAVAAVLGYGVAQVVPDGWPLPDTGALTAAQADLTQRLTAAEAAVAASDARVAELSGALDALRAEVAAQPEPQAAPDLQPLQDRLSALEGQLTTLSTLPAGDGPANAALAGQIAALQAEVARLAAAPAAAPVSPDVTEALAEAEAAATALRRQAAADRVAAALQTGAPYADALAPLGEGLPAALTGPAATGVATETALMADFPDAARAALAAIATEQAQGGGWGDRAMAFLQMQTGARSVTAREGDTPDAILSRAEAALRAGRLSDAVAEVSALPPTAAAPMADWLARAQATLDARAALAALQQGG